MASKKVMRDFQRCLLNITSFTDSQATIIQWDDDYLERFVVQVRPKDGPYKGGKFDFEVGLETGYPKTAPRVNCLTRIYHPNIDPTCDDYNVCLSMFDDWQEKYGLEDVIQGILFLLYNPNLEDPLSPFFDPEMSEEEYLENVQKSLNGEEVESEAYDANCEEPEFEVDSIESEVLVILDQLETLELNPEEEEEDEAIPDTGADNNNTDGDGCAVCQGAEPSGSNVDANTELVHRQESKVDHRMDVHTQPGFLNGLTCYIPGTFMSGDPTWDTLYHAFTITTGLCDPVVR